MVNQALAKVLRHNPVALIYETFKLGVTTDFFEPTQAVIGATGTSDG